MQLPSGPAELADGGLAIVFEDGSTSAPVVAVDSECGVDAEAFLRLLTRQECIADADCKVYRHGLAADQLDVCYAVRVDLNTSSRKFDSEYRKLAKACGRATTFSTQGCARSRCVNWTCEIGR